MARSTLNKGKRAFTFVEVILVMVLISFLYVVTTKVIQHNLEKKVPTYVYYLYKNLENESNLLTKKIINDAENGTNTALKEKLATLNSSSSKMQAILETMDGKKYGEYFAKDVNTIGAINSNSGISEVVTLSETYKNIVITNTNNMSRSFEYTVNDDGTPNIVYSPTRNEDKMKYATNYCYLWSANRGSNPKQTLQKGKECMYAPITTNITNLITRQNVNQWYKIDSVSNTVKVGGSASSLTATVYGDGSVANPDIEISTSNTITNIPDTLKDNNNQITLNIDTYSLKNKSPLFTSTNNINFHILTTKTKTDPGKVTLNRIYNYTLSKYSQEAICPNVENNNSYKLYRGKEDTSNYLYKNKDGQNALLKQFCKACTNYNFDSKYGECGSTNVGWHLIGDKSSSDINVTIKHPNGSIVTKDIASKKGGIMAENWARLFTGNNMGSKSINSLLEYKTLDCDKTLKQIELQYNIYNALKDKTLKYYMTTNVDNWTYKYIGTCRNNMFKQREQIYTTSAEKYYTKWNNFFKNTYKKTGTARKTISALSGSNIDEGKYEENNYTTTFKYPQNLTTESKYLNHIIYVSINTPFSKGENGKNIFAFEQFGDKIIPVGFLANDANSPLKFDVITRNPKTFKIEKVNYYNGTEKRPLTFCEAMSYTGEEFSQYCGCRWFGSGVLVTAPNQKGNPTYYREDGGGYPERIKLCNNNFGCIIRPVKPSSSGWF